MPASAFTAIQPPPEPGQQGCWHRDARRASPTTCGMSGCLLLGQRCINIRSSLTVRAEMKRVRRRWAACWRRLWPVPGSWRTCSGELRREGLIAVLRADGVITTAVAQAEHGHQVDRALTAEVTAMCVIVGALFPDQ